MNKEFIQKIIEASNIINKASKKGPANWILTGTYLLDKEIRKDKLNRRIKILSKIIERNI